MDELLSSTETEEEEGRGPEGTIDTVMPMSKSVPTAASTPTESFEGTVPASSSKRSTTVVKTSPYFNLTFHFTMPTQTTIASTKSAKKSNGKKTTVAEELSRRTDNTPESKIETEGASNIATGMQKAGGKQPE